MSVTALVVVFVGGLLCALGCEPFGWWILPWFGLAPLCWSLSRSKSYRNNILLGLSWGLGYHGLVLCWIFGIHPMTWLGVPWFYSILIALGCWLFVSLWGASLVVLWCVCLTFVGRTITKKRSHILSSVALWLALESLYSHTPLYWSSLALTQSPHNLNILQLGSLTGPSAISALLVIVNILLAQSFLFYRTNSKKSIYRVLGAIGIYSLAWAAGLVLYQRPLSSEHSFKIGLIQGNIANEIKLYPAGFKKAIAGYTTGYEQLTEQGAQIVITPETALPFAWDSQIKNGSFYRAILENKVPVLLGGFGRAKGGYTNSLFMVNSDGQLLGRYDKTKLVPLGEYIPFEEILSKVIQRLSPLKNSLQAGSEDQILNTPFGKVIVGICYESAYPELFRRQTRAGGLYIVTVSNDAHYSKAMPAQHHAQDVIRAIENDRWSARATNTGYSAIISPRGDLIWRSSLNHYQTFVDTIYTQNSQTPYVLYGDSLNWSLLLLAGLDLFFIDRRQKTSKIKES